MDASSLNLADTTAYASLSWRLVSVLAEYCSVMLTGSMHGPDLSGPHASQHNLSRLLQVSFVDWGLVGTSGGSPCSNAILSVIHPVTH